MVSRRFAQLLPLTILVVGAGACKPDIEGRPSLVSSVRLVAVQSIPAEAKPLPGAATSVEYRALLVGPDGPPDASELEWAYCTTRKPLVVTGPMAPVCYAHAGKELTQFQVRGPDVTADIPGDACSVFGPSPPAPKPGEPEGRPADPDTTGGYYQPIRVLVPTDADPEYGVAVTRLDCGLDSATNEQSIQYTHDHLPNENPALAAVDLVRSGGKSETLVAGTPARVAPGEAVTFRASWAKCPAKPNCGDHICSEGEATAGACADTDKTCCFDDCGAPPGCMGSECTPKGCTGSESYTFLDPALHALVKRREAMRVSWYATDGAYAYDHTGRTEAEADVPNTENPWTAPTTNGSVFIWVALHDDRGGVSFDAYEIDVHP